MISVTFRGITFRFEAAQLPDQYMRVQHLVGLGVWTHLDAAYCYRALREAVYGTHGNRAYHVRVIATNMRRGTIVTQIIEVVISDKEGALMEACRQVAAQFPTWRIRAALTDYTTYKKYLDICKFHAGQEVRV